MSSVLHSAIPFTSGFAADSDIGSSISIALGSTAGFDVDVISFMIGLGSFLEDFLEGLGTLWSFKGSEDWAIWLLKWILSLLNQLDHYSDGSAMVMMQNNLNFMNSYNFMCQGMLKNAKALKGQVLVDEGILDTICLLLLICIAIIT